MTKQEVKQMKPSRKIQKNNNNNNNNKQQALMESKNMKRKTVYLQRPWDFFPAVFQDTNKTIRVLNVSLGERNPPTKTYVKQESKFNRLLEKGHRKTMKVSNQTKTPLKNLGSSCTIASKNVPLLSGF